MKLYILIVVIAIIIGAIYVLSKDQKKSDISEIITVKPRVSANSNQENKQTSKEQLKGNVNGDKATAQYLSVLEKSEKYELAKEITTPNGFINTGGEPIKISDYIGKKIILVDFWTYSCINCQRTIPHLNDWHKKYDNMGLVIVGIHTPEFEFEKDYNNVKIAAEKFGIKYPIVLDNDYSTWTAYRNRYWPRKYLIDIDGYIVYDHIGEGAYQETEQKIQEVLAERMFVLGEKGETKQTIAKDAPNSLGDISPETYFGASRNQNFENGKPFSVGKQNGLTIPSQIYANKLYLSGDWDISEEFARNDSPNAGIVYKYTAKDVFFVAKAEVEIIVEVILDGKPADIGAGADVIKTSDGKTSLKIKEARLYKIISGIKSEEHTLELKIQKSSLEAFTFTFG